MRTGWVLTGLVVLCASLVGCGENPASEASASEAPQAASLAGNWLLAGSLPVAGPAAGSSPGSGVAATFDVVGNTVRGPVNLEETCTGFSTQIGGGIVSGTVAADGSFTLQSPAANGNPPLPGSTVTITGKVPSMAGGSWTGTYAIANPSGTCTTPLSGAIAATSIPLLSGSFSGTAALGAVSSGGVPAQVPVTISLQQGGISTVQGTGVYTNAMLSGTITIQGGSCLRTGSTATEQLKSAVEGSNVLASFLMNDGSTLHMFGNVAALDASRLEVAFVSLQGGTCPSVFTGYTSLSR